MQKSLARAILARVAALCNERNPSSVSPYGGQGEVTLFNDPEAIVQVSVVNTPTSQNMKLRIGPSEISPETDASALSSSEIKISPF